MLDADNNICLNETVGRIKNPLSMVAIFASISEVALAFVITKLPDNLQEIFIWFVMGFPTVLVFIFFFILYRKPAVFFSPGDYKKEELYVNSIGLNVLDSSIEPRLKNLEEITTSLQNFLEEIKPGTQLPTEYAKIRSTIKKQQELESNPLYSFLTGELNIEHDTAQKLIISSNSIFDLPNLMDAEVRDSRKVMRLSRLITSFPKTAADFQSLKSSIPESGAQK